MLQAIEGADQYVHLETYILRSDLTGRLFLAALAERARAGVEVRLLYDAIGSRGLEEHALEPLLRAGGDVVAFNPLRGIVFAPRRRDHRKILIVDGRVGFTGGLNIGSEYRREEDGEPSWRDAHVRIEGPLVRDLAAVFLESWFRADGPDLPWDAFLAEEPAHSGDVRGAILADGPVYRRRRMRDLIVSALEGAERSVALASPYFAPGRRVLEALASASARGVKVELLLAGETDHPVLKRAARSILPRLLRAGVHVFEYEKSMMHGKLAVFDDEWAVVGSSNLDRQSLQHAYEVNLIVESSSLPRELRASFAKDLQRSRRLEERSLLDRGLVDRLLDRLAALLLLFV
jgi:cardiolipin synthase